MMNLKELVEFLKGEKPFFQRRTFKNILVRYAETRGVYPENLPENKKNEYDKATNRKKIMLWLEYGDAGLNEYKYM